MFMVTNIKTRFGQIGPTQLIATRNETETILEKRSTEPNRATRRERCNTVTSKHPNEEQQEHGEN